MNVAGDVDIALSRGDDHIRPPTDDRLFCCRGKSAPERGNAVNEIRRGASVRERRTSLHHPQRATVQHTLMGLLAITTLAFTLPAAGEDIGGWHETKWGMTTDEVQKVLGQPTRAADLEKVCHEPCNEGAALELDDFELNGQHFVVRLWFSKPGTRLQAVSLYAKQLDDSNGNEAFTKMKGCLEASYGKPASIAMKRGDFVISWTQPSTAVTLYSNATNYVTIVYEQRSDHEPGKP